MLERVRATGLLRAGEPVVVLLSGGRDSVCLLDVAVELAGAEAVSALHVDYGLRAGSEDDAESCAALCERLGVPLELERATPRPEKGNLQAWAREVRYSVGERRAAARGALLAVGHTATDQAETILYRLAASPGRRALLGMQPRSGLVVRPLLEVTREETAAWCRARGLPWREDVSNASDAFARNRIRHELLPALEAVDPRAAANVVRTSRLLREEAEVLDVVVQTALAGRDRIAVDHLAALPRAVGRLVLRRLAEDVAGGLCPRAASRLDDVLGLRDGAIDLGDGVRALVEEGVLRMAPTPPLGAPSPR